MDLSGKKMAAKSGAIPGANWPSFGAKNEQKPTKRNCAFLDDKQKISNSVKIFWRVYKAVALPLSYVGDNSLILAYFERYFLNEEIFRVRIDEEIRNSNINNYAQ